MTPEELSSALQSAALTYVREVNRRWQNRPENQTNGRPRVSCQDRLTKGRVPRSTSSAIRNNGSSGGEGRKRRPEVRHSGCDAVFRREKFLQRPGQHGGQFLPSQQLQPAAQNAASDRPHDGIPALDQIRPPCIAQDAERTARRMGCKHAAN